MPPTRKFGTGTKNLKRPPYCGISVPFIPGSGPAGALGPPPRGGNDPGITKTSDSE